MSIFALALVAVSCRVLWMKVEGPEHGYRQKAVITDHYLTSKHENDWSNTVEVLD
jgi:hypothetical protein